jgi:hypothetical protein
MVAGHGRGRYPKEKEVDEGAAQRQSSEMATPIA